MQAKRVLRVLVTLMISFDFFVTNRAQDGPHPLDPLTENEIRLTSNIIKYYWPEDYAVHYIVLKEPSKELLLPYFLDNSNPPGNLVPRRASAVIMVRSNNQIYHLTVNLDRNFVEEWEAAPEETSYFLTNEEDQESWAIVQRDPDVQMRCAQLGYANMSLVISDSWPMGYIGDRPEYLGKRLAQLYFYGRNFEDDNEYAHPFDFIAIVDLQSKSVIAFEELPTHDNFDGGNKEGNIVPRESANFDPDLRDSSSFRRDLKPVKVSQEGTSFTMTGNEIQWQKYKLRVGFNGREGLVLYFVNYNDTGIVRPLFYRMSLAEMFVPYGDPRPPYHRKHVFDMGQYGLGLSANTLEPNIDCIGEVMFVDAFLHDEQGEPMEFPRVVCVREEDAGVLWKHTDYKSGKRSLVRSQRLAITFIATIGNYDYLFTWNFHQDGTIEYNVKLTGILNTKLMAVGATPFGYGSVVMPQVNAAYHQHFFSLRLDVEIDGNKNRVTVSDAVPGPGATNSSTNPYGQAFTSEKTVLATAGEARTNVAPEKSRTWIVTNPDTENPNTGGQTGWKLIPYPSTPMLLRDDSPLHPQAAWMDYHTWVTPYKEDQLYPGGQYLNNSGLPEWVEENESANILDTDVVLWHNFGLSHVPRAEDFPVMPVESCSIFLKPYNFFRENPALDVLAPPTTTGRNEP